MGKERRWCTTRREFLLTGGGAVMTLLLAPDLVLAEKPVALRVATYPRKRIAKLSRLKQDVPVAFQYPHADPFSVSYLIKLGVQAAGGVGPEKDIVAFNLLCTHRGGELDGTYRAKYKVLGPCPLHLTTYDLTRHGMVVAGHATESLPQVVLEVVGDDIYATGVMGLIYGYYDNLAARKA